MNKFVMYFVLCISMAIFSAQFEIVKDVYEDTGSITAQQFGYKDHNGDYVAILKVKTDIEKLAFSSMTLDKSEYMGNGIYHVYMQPGSRMLEFMKTGFISIKHQFPRPLESNKVYVIEVKGVGEKIEEIGIVVQTDPANAKVFIDGTEFSNDTQISIGKHTLKATRDGYEPYIEEIEVSAKNIHFEIKLEKVKQAGVLIRTEPEEGTVYINGIKMGNTPLTDFHPTGSYELKIVKEGYVDIIETLEIVSPKTEKSYQLQKNVVKITVITEPEKNMDIYLNGRKTEFKSDYTFLDMPPGKYIVSAKSQFYETAENEIVLDIGEIEEVKLQASSNFGIITINTDKKAEVYLNGNRIYELKDIMLEPQKCNIEVRMKKAETLNESYLLQRNDNKVFNMFPVIPTGTVQVAVLPSDAKIEFSEEGGESFSAVGMGIFENVPVGNYKLVITKDKYKTYSKNIIIEEGQTVKETGVRLEEIKEIPITIDSDPEGAEVYLDGSYFGRTPFKKTLQIKDYEMTLKKDGYRECKTLLNLNDGNFNKKIIQMKEKADPVFSLVWKVPILFGDVEYNFTNTNFGVSLGELGFGFKIYKKNEFRIFLLGASYFMYDNYKKVSKFEVSSLYTTFPVSITYRRYIRTNERSSLSVGFIIKAKYMYSEYGSSYDYPYDDRIRDEDVNFVDSGLGINFSFDIINLYLMYSKPVFFSKEPVYDEIKDCYGGFSIGISLQGPGSIYRGGSKSFWGRGFQ